MYTVDYFLDKFEKIPEHKWTTGVFIQGDRRCGNGHCGVTDSNCCDGMTKEAVALNLLFEEHGYLNYKYPLADWGAVAIVNDNHGGEYQQPTPKQRILAALRDIKKMNSEQSVQECDATKLSKEQEAGPKTIHVYHVVKVSQSILDQEMILQ